MARQQVQFIAMNRGLVSKYALARVDLQRMRYSAELMTNWMPRVFGPMMLRPGLEYIGDPSGFTNKVVCIPFIRATDDAQWVECVPGSIRPMVDEAPIIRPAVATTVTNGDFTTDLSGWTNADQAGASSFWAAPGTMKLIGTGNNDAIEYQEVTVALADRGVEHGIRFNVGPDGPVGLRIGTALGLDDLQGDTLLGVGIHSLAVTPPGASFFIYFYSRLAYPVDVREVEIEGPGWVSIPSSWQAADLPLLRYSQSADVVYVADGSHQQKKIERRAPRSWSLVDFAPVDGPFRPINYLPTTVTPSATDGIITLTANSPIFQEGHEGALFRLASSGQDVEATLAGAGQFTPSIRVTGVGTQRNYTVTVSSPPGGTYVGTLKLETSQDNVTWTQTETVTNGGIHNDGLDNQILYKRVEMTVYSSGSVDVELSFSGGSINGIVRVDEFTDNLNVTARVIAPLGSTTATNLWYEGAWSDYRGWPTCLVLQEDRLWHCGLGQIWGSVTDSYESYDDTVVGDSGPISRTIGKGPVDWINWMLGLLRLLFGTDGTLASARSDSLDTPLTPSNFNLKYPVSQGAARIAPVSADDNGYFVHRNLVRLYELKFDTSNYIKLDYGAEDMTAICPEVCEPGIVRIAVQRHPDTRIHCVLSDGTVAVMVRDPLEDVMAWVKVELDQDALGPVVEVLVLPGTGLEDRVIYVTSVLDPAIEGYNSHYLKWAQESDCVGGDLNKQADAFVTFTSVDSTNTITGLPSFLEGLEVVVWGDGEDLSPGMGGDQKLYTVTDGTVTLDAGIEIANAIVGLPYQAQFKGAKLAYAAQGGSALTMTKIVVQLGLLLADTHSHGLTYGPDFDTQDDLPMMEDEAEVPYDFVWGPVNGNQMYDKRQFTFPGDFDTDTRLCLVAQAPRPCRVMAAVVDLKTNEG